MDVFVLHTTYYMYLRNCHTKAKKGYSVLNMTRKISLPILCPFVISFFGTLSIDNLKSH